MGEAPSAPFLVDFYIIIINCLLLQKYPGACSHFTWNAC